MISEIESNLPKCKPIKEAMGVYIPGINSNIPNFNGFIWSICGSGGSGKSSMLFNLFKKKEFFRGKFDNIYLFQPVTSFLSVEKHPFQNHNKVYHELNQETLEQINDELTELKNSCVESGEPIEHSLIIVDDFANDLKDADLLKALNKMIIKTRHINCSWIFTLQAWKYCPLILRKQVNYITIFKPKSNEEWLNISKEAFNIGKDQQKLIHEYVFSEPYAHLDYNIRDGTLYKNFNKLIIN